MKKIWFILLLMLCCSTLFADDYLPVEIIYNDGKVITGFALPFIKARDKYIIFKSNKKSDRTKILANDLKTIIYGSGGHKSVYDRMNVYKNNIRQTKTFPAWVLVIKRGIVTLYEIAIKKTSYTNGIYFKYTDYYFLCYRAGEKAAVIICDGKYTNSYTPNYWFRREGPKYFSDFPELAEKIKNKTYTYKDLDLVIDIYNDWAEQTKTKNYTPKISSSPESDY